MGRVWGRKGGRGGAVCVCVCARARACVRPARPHGCATVGCSAVYEGPRADAYHAHPWDEARRSHGLLLLVLQVLLVLLVLLVRREAQVTVADGVNRASRESLGDDEPLEAVRLHALPPRGDGKGVRGRGQGPAERRGVAPFTQYRPGPTTPPPYTERAHLEDRLVLTCCPHVAPLVRERLGRLGISGCICLLAPLLAHVSRALGTVCRLPLWRGGVELSIIEGTPIERLRSMRVFGGSCVWCGVFGVVCGSRVRSLAWMRMYRLRTASSDRPGSCAAMCDHLFPTSRTVCKIVASSCRVHPCFKATGRGSERGRLPSCLFEAHNGLEASSVP